VQPADWMQGNALPTAPGSGRERVITEWDSQFAEIGIHMRTIYRDGWVCTAYEKSTRDVGFNLALLYQALQIKRPLPDFRYDGTEGELYNMREDPLQWRNLWNDLGCAKIRAELVGDLYDHLPAPRIPMLAVEAPA
jgi:hypothetical protein